MFQFPWKNPKYSTFFGNLKILDPYLSNGLIVFMFLIFGLAGIDKMDHFNTTMTYCLNILFHALLLWYGKKQLQKIEGKYKSYVFILLIPPFIILIFVLIIPFILYLFGAH